MRALLKSEVCALTVDAKWVKLDSCWICYHSWLHHVTNRLKMFFKSLFICINSFLPILLANVSLHTDRTRSFFCLLLFHWRIKSLSWKPGHLIGPHNSPEFQTPVINTNFEKISRKTTLHSCYMKATPLF